MDIISHTLTGIAAGTVVAAFVRSSDLKRWIPLFTGAVGGALPDLDAISAWSGFDSTLGRFFYLQHPGKEIYSSHYWYGHHGFMHSLLAALMFGLLWFALNFLFRKTVLRKAEHLLFRFKKDWTWILAFITGFVFHLLEDMPTPASTWGGVAFWWPSATYVGGTGKIWWWNNYDVFLIILLVILLNVALLIILKRRKLFLRWGVPMVFLLGLYLSLHQIRHRSFDFNYKAKSGGYTKLEMKSKQIQLQILGPRVYRWMNKLDHHLGVNF